VDETGTAAHLEEAPQAFIIKAGGVPDLEAAHDLVVQGRLEGLEDGQAPDDGRRKLGIHGNAPLLNLQQAHLFCHFYWQRERSLAAMSIVDERQPLQLGQPCKRRQWQWTVLLESATGVCCLPDLPQACPI